jgi:hypothetical protein
MWPLMLPYLLVAVALTRVWHPWQERMTRRWWPENEFRH